MPAQLPAASPRVATSMQQLLYGCSNRGAPREPTIVIESRRTIVIRVTRDNRIRVFEIKVREMQRRISAGASEYCNQDALRKSVKTSGHVLSRCGSCCIDAATARADAAGASRLFVSMNAQRKRYSYAGICAQSFRQKLLFPFINKISFPSP
jgi:hypothetical protein